MKLSTVFLAAAFGLLASAAPAPQGGPTDPPTTPPTTPPGPQLPFNATFALRVLAPGAWFHGRSLDVAGDFGGAVNLLQPSLNPQFPENQFCMERDINPAPNSDPQAGYLRYKGFNGDLRLFAGFDRRQQGIKIFEMVNSPGNPNPIKFHDSISFATGVMTIRGKDNFFMCNTQKTNGQIVAALNWDSTGRASWSGCWKVSVIQTSW